MATLREIIKEAIKEEVKRWGRDFYEQMIVEAFNREMEKYEVYPDMWHYYGTNSETIWSFVISLEEIAEDEKLINSLIDDIERLVGMETEWDEDENRLTIFVTDFEGIDDSFYIDYEKMIKDIKPILRDKYEITEYELDDEVMREDRYYIEKSVEEILTGRAGEKIFLRNIKVRDRKIFRDVQRLFSILEKYGIEPWQFVYTRYI